MPFRFLAQAPSPRWHLRLAGTLLALASATTSLHAYEADVHYGLTEWLALKAGFTDWQARAIATGNYRVDSGLMSTLSLVLDYACLRPDAAVARRIQQRHYPSAVAVPAAPAERIVQPGSAAAYPELARTLEQARGNEAQYLGLLGAALHPLQDSWSHAGIPAVPTPGAALACEPRLASAPPAGKQPDPHATDRTATAAAATLAMADATYNALQTFPSVGGHARTAQPWTTLLADVKAFAALATKAEKQAWFAARGLDGSGYLNDTTLPDGAQAVEQAPTPRQLPSAQQPGAVQHDTPAGAREFFDRLMLRWLGDEPVDAVLAEMAYQVGGSKKPASPSGSGQLAQLSARLKLWRLRDHGSTARLAHTTGPLSARQLAEVDRLAKRPAASIGLPLDQAVLPLVATGPNPSPILPYVLRTLPARAGHPERVAAFMRLKHAPRDTLAWIAERTESGWVLTDLLGVVDQ